MDVQKAKDIFFWGGGGGGRENMTYEHVSQYGDLDIL